MGAPVVASRGIPEGCRAPGAPGTSPVCPPAHTGGSGETEAEPARVAWHEALGLWCHPWGVHCPPQDMQGRGGVSGAGSCRVPGGKGGGKERDGRTKPQGTWPCATAAQLRTVPGVPLGVTRGPALRGAPPARGAAGGGAGPNGCPQGWLGTGGAGVAALSRCHRAICRQRHRPWHPAQCSQSAAALGKDGPWVGSGGSPTLGCCPSWSPWEVGFVPQGVIVPRMGHSRDSPAPATNRLNVILFHTPPPPKM